SLVLSAMTLFISYEINIVQATAEKEKRLAEERIRLFNQQIQPHYIFNSLAVIKYLCRKDPDEACKTIDEFSGYLRESTDFMNGADLVPIEREIDLVKHYFYMQQKNYGDTITFECDAEDTDFQVPPFTVQTCVENALKHGLRSQVMEDGKLTVRTFFDGNDHTITVEDNGIGFDTDILKHSQEGHVGIRNTRARLHLLCDGTMEIQSESGKGTRVTISIPKEKKR
ncbi:MAG: histidine kinase, partial [Clostridia bacterium]|nr:histidine kinase [Clostridia bacterium]